MSNISRTNSDATPYPQVIRCGDCPHYQKFKASLQTPDDIYEFRDACASCKHGIGSDAGIYKSDLVGRYETELDLRIKADTEVLRLKTKADEAEAKLKFKPNTGKKSTAKRLYGKTVREYKAEGLSQRKVAKILGINRRTVARIWD